LKHQISFLKYFNKNPKKNLKEKAQKEKFQKKVKIFHQQRNWKNSSSSKKNKAKNLRKKTVEIHIKGLAKFSVNYFLILPKTAKEGKEAEK
jgi:hypothetical protein